MSKIVISGASGGLGEALARHYAARGATLGLIARRGERLQSLAAQLAVPVEIYCADVRDAAALAEAARDFMARHGCPDLVIANAGISAGTLTDHAADAEVFREILDTNVLGTVNTFQPFLAAMRTARKGILAGIASVAGFRGLPGAGAYSASKAAAITYLESLRVELHGSGVAVVTICPGYVATPMTANNPYPMPFILAPQTAAAKIAAVIAQKRRFAVVPWQMALAGRLLKLLPRGLYDRLFVGAPHKPRRGAT